MNIKLLCMVIVLISSFYKAQSAGTIDEMETKGADLRPIITPSLIWSFKGTALQDTQEFVPEFVKEGGNLIFFGCNVVSPILLENLTNDLWLMANNPTSLFWTDREGGLVDRLPKSKGFLNSPPSAKTIVESYSVEQLDKVEEIYRLSAMELQQYHLHNFGTVVDLDGGCPAISKYGRSYSLNPNIITDYSSANIKGHNLAGCITALKHYGGHGLVKTDSHFGLPDATDTYSADELIPYKKLIDMGIAQVIMSAHIVNKQYDSSGTPATFSKTMIDDKLRKNLGFEGVVVSDALEMGAIQKYLSNELNTSDPQRIFEESMVRALSICDQVLWCKRDSYTPKQAETAILKAIEVGTLTEGNLKSKYEKIINLKKSTTTSIK